MDLLIIGNGFDKQCGLKSSFNDYYSYKLENDEFCKAIQKDYKGHDSYSFTNMLIRGIEDKSIEKYSIWDILFLNNKMQRKTNWADLEETIYQSLVASDGNGFYWEQLMEYLDDKRFWRNEEIIAMKLLRESKITQLTAFYIRRKYYELFSQKGMTKKDLYFHLEKELIVFENSFVDYMNKIIKKDYYKKQIKLLDKLSVKKRVILSFNYTNIKQTFFPVENVHGTLADNNIIIGIDGKELRYDEDIFRFTKTYRKTKLLNTKKTVPILSKQIKNIIFYGHSLNPQDYSYFQSIFDYVNLYSNEYIQLIFYYSIFDESRKSEIVKAQYESIVELISSYGSTLDNKDKGKNLLHKLLLKNAIQLRKL